ncbi:gliding motility protein [Streptomyces sp. PCS3-D2]|nr:hypothetical protein [Streptomyces sp. PCS3-D2]WKV71510.1 gliding motility protein [Streptomyces sp. PCS3-D2]
MGVFDRFFRRRNEAVTEGVATAAPAAESGAAGESEPAAAQSEPAEAVEIPKQQSAEVAADSEAGEGART